VSAKDGRYNMSASGAPKQITSFSKVQVKGNARTLQSSDLEKYMKDDVADPRRKGTRVEDEYDDEEEETKQRSTDEEDVEYDEEEEEEAEEEEEYDEEVDTKDEEEEPRGRSRRQR
jgi:hypothetical protein